MEKKPICENTTVYDLEGHIEFNHIVASTRQWILYGVSMMIGLAAIVLYIIYKTSAVFMLGVTLVILINVAKFLFQPRSIRRTFAEIAAVRGEMTFFYRFYEDGFDQLCRSNKGEMAVEISFECLKKIVETRNSFFFMTRDNSGYFVKKQYANADDNARLSEILKKYKIYKYSGRK